MHQEQHTKTEEGVEETTEEEVGEEMEITSHTTTQKTAMGDSSNCVTVVTVAVT